MDEEPDTMASSQTLTQGFTLATDLLDTDGQCFAVGWNAVVGVEATVLGPPPGLQDLTQAGFLQRFPFRVT